MAYFDQDFIKFFSELEQNNHKDWFQRNKKLYEKKVKLPFRVFVAALIDTLENKWGSIPYDAKDFILRINRDIRFSKDKTPYKTHVEAMISAYGKKEYTRPGIFLQVNHKGLKLYTGSYMLEKENLYRVRTEIVNNMKEFEKLTTDATFLSVFGDILGDKHKRIDKEFREAAEKQPLIFHKGFYYGFELDEKALLKDDLIEVMMEKFAAADGMNAFLDRVLGG
ncbi:MAG: DUF2461 domain-containing protein [Bacteroidota bacterium]